MLKRIRVVCDNDYSKESVASANPVNTHIYDADTGEEITNVSSFEFKASAGEIVVHAKLEIIPSEVIFENMPADLADATKVAVYALGKMDPFRIVEIKQMGESKCKGCGEDPCKDKPVCP
jgi:hypothetical protein